MFNQFSFQEKSGFSFHLHLFFCFIFLVAFQTERHGAYSKGFRDVCLRMPSPEADISLLYISTCNIIIHTSRVLVTGKILLLCCYSMVIVCFLNGSQTFSSGTNVLYSQCLFLSQAPAARSWNLPMLLTIQPNNYYVSSSALSWRAQARAWVLWFDIPNLASPTWCWVFTAQNPCASLRSVSASKKYENRVWIGFSDLSSGVEL